MTTGKQRIKVETTGAQSAGLKKFWRALYVASRSEKRVLESLRSSGVEAYVPIVRTMRQWSDRKKMVDLPLLNGYVFIRVSESEHDRVVQTRGVVSFVRSEGRIATVRDEEITRLKQLVELGYQMDVLAIDRQIRTGERVKVSSGILKGLEGVVAEDRDQRHLLVLLESIGQCVRVRLPKDILNPAT